MRKRDELTRGCMAKAGDEEMTFVLLSRDEDAPGLIMDWVARRIRRGKNKVNDPQILEAIECAKTMEAEGAKHKPTEVISRPCAEPTGSAGTRSGPA